MPEKIAQVYNAQKWARLLAVGLVGWLVFLFSAFLVIIGISALFNASGLKVTFGSGLFIVEVVATILISAATCIFFSRKSHVWFSQAKPKALYITLAILICVTVLSFPAPFMFSMEYLG